MSIDPFKIKDINISNIGDIRFENNSTDRSYGRRFRVRHNNQHSEDVIFKDILNKVESLVKKSVRSETVTIKELRDLKTLVHYLRDVEKDASLDYKNRDNPYKFRTWFHRLFSSGAHLNKIADLEATINTKISQLNMSVKGIDECTIQEALIEPLISQKKLPPISFDKLHLLKAMLGSEAIVIDEYHICHEHNLIKVRAGEKELKITFTPSGVVDSLQCDGIDKGQEIPEDFSTILTKFFYEGLRKACRYDRVRVIKAALQYQPAWHLHQWILQDACSITYLEEDGSRQEGIDARGLTRDYLDSLIGSLTADRALFHALNLPNQTLPHIDRKILNRSVPVCSKKEEQAFYDLGTLMSRCHESQSEEGHRNILTGCYFSDALFRGITALTDKEIDAPFENLQLETYIKLAKAILKEWDLGNEGNTNKALERSLDLLEKIHLDNCLKNNDISSLHFLYIAAGYPEEFDDGFGGPDLDKIKADPLRFRIQCQIGLFRNADLVEPLNGASIGSLLAPIHSIARGWKKDVGRKQWKKICSSNPLKLSEKVQGMINREEIISKIENKSTNPNIATKCTWLTNWISDSTNGATDQEIKQFLKFLCGTNALSKNQVIKVQEGNDGSPIPIAETCFLTIQFRENINGTPLGAVYPDGDSEGFIQCLKEAISHTDFGFS